MKPAESPPIQNRVVGGSMVSAVSRAPPFERQPFCVLGGKWDESPANPETRCRDGPKVPIPIKGPLKLDLAAAGL